MSENRFCIEYAKRGTAGCKKCKQKIDKGVLRIAKVVPNPFTESGGDMKQWFHVGCIFEQLSRARATTKKIDDPGDLDGWAEIQPDDRKLVLQHINDLASKTSAGAKKATPKKQKAGDGDKCATTAFGNTISPPEAKNARSEPTAAPDGDVGHPSRSRDDAFKEFRRLCASISDESTYTGKTAAVARLLERGSEGKGFTGDLFLWVKFLLPTVNKRIYNLQSKQLVKLFARIFGGGCHEEMVEDLERGDVAETVRLFFEKYGEPAKKSTLTLQEVDDYLERLTSLTREDDQEELLRRLSLRCTGNDLKMVVRLIKHDVRINAGPKHVLEALHPEAYPAFQVSRNLLEVVRATQRGNVKVSATLLTPMIPMLAEACGSAEAALAKCPGGLYAEIKYDGERVQLHKSGTQFLFFSRSLKPVAEHKVSHLHAFIPRAFPHGRDLVLDSEILMVDESTGKPLPFGTLGKHKRTAFRDAAVCLFVFDCLHYNGESLLQRPLRERRSILRNNMTPVENRVVFGEQHEVKTAERLKELIADVLSQGLEGLVLKDPDGVYEPGKRRWLKVKKDYLKGGSMADSADLAVLGAYFGTGNNGGIMSVFLMGCWDPAGKRWCTVTKVHGGHDDETLERLQTELRMEKISRRAERVPGWLHVQKALVPDFVAEDPERTQVWEISGAEFTRAEIHTADGISIRFPRVTRIRTDKTAREATTLPELRHLFRESRQHAPFDAEKSNSAARPSEDDAAARTPSGAGKRRASDDGSERDEGATDDGASRGGKRKVPNQSTEVERAAAAAGTEKGKSSAPTPAERNGACSFPDVFTGVRMLLPENRLLRRYFVAYDGELAKDGDATITHAVAGTGVARQGVRVVREEWLWDSIRRQERQDETKYA